MAEFPTPEDARKFDAHFYPTGDLKMKGITYVPKNKNHPWRVLYTNGGPTDRHTGSTSARTRRRTDDNKDLKTPLNGVQFFERVPGEMPGMWAERMAEADF